MSVANVAPPSPVADRLGWGHVRWRNKELIVVAVG
jgi:hypothetical protein